jgi:glycosyltransferase involved in cell wall biosynthesis
MIKRNAKRKRRAFCLAFSSVFLIFTLFYGMGTVYVNSRNILYKEKIEILRIEKTGDYKACLNIAGQKYEFPLPKETGVNPYLYGLMPALPSLIIYAMEKCADLIF